MDWFGLAGKKFLVTGASSGIGQAAAVKISQLGGHVVLNGRNTDRLQQTLSMLAGEGHYAMPYDLTNHDGIKNFVRGCIQTDGERFDGLVFSAGIARNVPIRAESVTGFQDILNVNTASFISLLNAFSSKRVLNDGGSIVAVSSLAAKFPNKLHVSYAASKAAVDAACAVAAHEFADRKVRVNSVQPGMTCTPMTKVCFEQTTAQQREKKYPLGPNQPSDIADVIVFLLSDMSRKVTGQNILIDAGNFGAPADLFFKNLYS